MNSNRISIIPGYTYVLLLVLVVLVFRFNGSTSRRTRKNKKSSEEYYVRTVRACTRARELVQVLLLVLVSGSYNFDLGVAGSKALDR
jgi:hypothetical protein